MASSSVPAASTDVDSNHQHKAMAAKESALVDFLRPKV
jgi:hypothetical protein